MSLAIAGLIIVQVIWINNALTLKKAQFDQDVRQSLVQVTKLVPQVVAQNQELQLEEARKKGLDAFLIQRSMFNSPFEDPSKKIQPKQLDSLIKKEFTKKGLGTKYAFGVFDRNGTPLFFKDSASKKFANDLIRGELNIQLFQGDMFSNIFQQDMFSNTYFLSVFFPQKSQYVFGQMWLILSLSLILILVVIYAFYYSVYTIHKQKKLSEIKNDFINNMTHELKTPISTIQLACEALKDVDMQQLEIKDQFVDIIDNENKRLGGLVETVLKTAVLDKGQLKLKLDEFDMLASLYSVVNNFDLKLQQKNGTIKIDTQLLDMMLVGDHQLLSNVFSNLIDNSLKYSNQTPEIIIKASVKREGYCIQVIDNGIGIKKENQDKIFDKLYRVPTGDVHDVKGFGLGLNYVQTIVEMHGGNVSVKSTFGKGATFTVWLPKEQINIA